MLKNTRPTKTIICAQKKAEKVIISEENLLQANYNSFGEEIGKITNRITAMYDVQTQFSKDSVEYKTLDYRIMCGQLLQQNAIDKTKGIISKPMPESWYNRFSLLSQDNDNEEEKKAKEFNYSILADKKPYFMCYIYPQEMKKYKDYIENTGNKAEIEFGMSIAELRQKEILSESETNFLKWYDIKMPVGVNNCTMNRLCWKIEQIFDGHVSSVKKQSGFDYQIMKNGIDYDKNLYYKLREVYKKYSQDMANYSMMSNKYHLDKEQSDIDKVIITDNYKKECDTICSNEITQCDILLDLCYKSEKSKKFVWDMCGHIIVSNLLSFNDNKITYYIKGDGNIEYAGVRYKTICKEIAV